MIEPIDSVQTDPSAADLMLLQGSWEQVYVEVDGVANPTDGYTAPAALTRISGDRFSVRTADGALLLEGSFLLDPATEPKSITWIDSIGVDAGKHLPASYVLEGDSFVFIAADEGAPRPTVFHTTLGLTMRAFIRRR